MRRPKAGWALGAAALVGAIAGLAVLAFVVLGGGGDDAPSILMSGGDTSASRHELAYFSQDGSLWLYDADTGERRVLAQDGTCGKFSRLEWSPTGNRLACIGSDGGETFAGGRIVIRDADGNVTGRIEEAGLDDFYWSPTGDVLLYGVELFVEPPTTSQRHYRIADATGRQIADLGAWDLTGVTWPAWAWYGFPFWSPQGTDISYRPSLDAPAHRFSLILGDHTFGGQLSADYPLAYTVNGTEFIMATEYTPAPASDALPSYHVFETCRHCLPHGLGKALSELDNGTQFWTAPPWGETIIYVTRDQRSDGLPGLGVIDLLSGEAKPIKDSLITFGSDAIPSEWVTFSPDGKYVYWLGGDNNGYRARIDGSGLEKIVSLDQPAFDWSPDHRMVSYVSFTTDGVTDTNTLYIVLPDGRKRVIDERSTSGGGVTTVPLGYAWRPEAVGNQ